MDFKELATKCINEGFEKGGKLIEMGEFDPMYPEAPQEESPVSSPVSLNSDLLKELLVWAGAEDQAAHNVAEKAVELSATGPLTSDHLMDLTGAADYEQPGCGMSQATPSGVVSPVVPSGPMSPVMASYQRRTKAILEGVASPETMGTKRNKGNQGLNVKKIKEVIASIGENDEEGLYKTLDDIQNPESEFWSRTPKKEEPAYDMEEEEEELPIEDPELEGGLEIVEPGEEGGEPIPQEDLLDAGELDGEVEDIGDTSQSEIADEISDIDAASDTLEGAVDGAADAVGDAAPGSLDDVDPSILDGDKDGETVEHQIAEIKAKIDSIAAELGVEIEDDVEDEFDSEDEVDDDEYQDDVEDEVLDVEDELDDVEDEEEFDDMEDVEDEVEDVEDELEDVEDDAEEVPLGSPEEEPEEIE